MMTGVKDPTEPTKVENAQTDNNGDGSNLVKIRSISIPQFFEIYTSLKNSNETVASILSSVQNRLNDGIEFVAPIKEKIGAALETPLNNARDTANSVSTNLDKQLSIAIVNIKDILSCDCFRPLVDYFRWVESSLSKYAPWGYNKSETKTNENDKS